MVAGRAVSWFGLRAAGAACFVLSISYLLQLGFGPNPLGSGDAAYRGVSSFVPYGPGGWIALRTTPFLIAKFGGPGL